RIVATLSDYRTVRDLVANVYAEGVEATVSATVRQTVEAVRAHLAGDIASVSLTALAKKLGLDKNSVHHRVRKGITAGYLLNEELRKGKPARIVLGDPLPDEGGVLPPPEALDACTHMSPPESLQHSNSDQKPEAGEEVEVLETAFQQCWTLENSNTPSNGHSNSLSPDADKQNGGVLECWSENGGDRCESTRDPGRGAPTPPSPSRPAEAAPPYAQVESRSNGGGDPDLDILGFLRRCACCNRPGVEVEVALADRPGTV